MKIVSVSKVVPYPDVPHAGGRYYYEHVRALLNLGHEVTIVAPCEAGRNRDALERIDLPVDVHLFGRDFEQPALRDRLLTGRLSRSARADFFRDTRVVELLRAADAIEFQWSETAELLPRLRSMGVRTPAITIAHDILLQRETRRLNASKKYTAKWLLNQVRVGLVALDERRAYAASDHIATFSEKDASLQVVRKAGRPVSVLYPPLAPPVESTYADRDSRCALLVGAYRRPENAEAAIWLLREVWPLVVRQTPSAQLIIAGANPTEQMTRLASEIPGVEVTGLVESLAPYYERCQIGVVSTHTGAGVKFKTVDALLSGQALVSTTVGIEGIPCPDGSYWAVADDAVSFASAVVSAMTRPVESTRVGGKGAAWARERYSRDQFEESLASLLQTVRETNPIIGRHSAS